MEVNNSVSISAIKERRDQVSSKTPILWTNLVKSPSEIAATATIENNIKLDAVLKNQQELMKNSGIGDKFIVIG